MHYAQLGYTIVPSMRRPPESFYGFTAKQIADMCSVDLATARRWKRGATCPPKMAEWIMSGDLGFLDRAWRGWRLSRGRLVSPEGWIATPGDVLSIQLTQAQLSTYRTENRALKEALAAAEAGLFEEQPHPDQWEIALEG